MNEVSTILIMGWVANNSESDGQTAAVQPQILIIILVGKSVLQLWAPSRTNGGRRTRIPLRPHSKQKKKKQNRCDGCR